MEKIENIDLVISTSKRVIVSKYNCEACNDKGWIRCSEDEGYIEDYNHVAKKMYYMKKCRCRNEKEFKHELIKMGLNPILDKIMKVEYETKLQWQKDTYKKAKEFVKDERKGLIISGQTGSGKTLLLGKMLYNFVALGKTAMYFDWHNDFKGKLVDRYNVVDEKLINQMLNVDVLYIDDLFKVANNDLNELRKKNQEIMVARKIIDRRATISGKKTMISMELFSEDIEKVEPSLNGRLIEMTGTFDNWINMDSKDNRNIRLLQAQGKF